MKFVSRKAWGARSPRAAAGRLASTKGVKVHYTGSTENAKMLTDHGLCAPRVRRIQKDHMDGNGWNDIGYTALVCPHGHVFEGRGRNRLPAANGEGLNSGHYAVCGLVGNKGLVTPPSAMLGGIRDAIEWLRKEGEAGREIKGHRDGYATDCPGAALYAWVKKGAPRPDEEDDVSAKDVWDYGIDTGDGKAKWRAGTVLGHLEKTQDETNAMLKEALERLAGLESRLAALEGKTES
jgi:hypothetical protein